MVGAVRGYKSAAPARSPLHTAAVAMLVASLFALSFTTSSGDSLQAQVQDFLNGVATESGYSFSVGYRDAKSSWGLGAGPRVPSGFNISVPGTAGVDDTFLLGSGTKPFTASAIMRLVEAKKIALDDAASKYIDPVLKMMGHANATSLVGLFGAKAAKVTVGHLLSMESGIGDFDVPGYDDALLKAGTSYHSVLEPLIAVGAFPAHDGCDPRRSTDPPCTFVCDPGTCKSYSSTNYILAGLVLLANAPSGQQSVGTFNQLAALGLDPASYPHLHTPTRGPLNGSLDVVGASEAFGGKTALWGQDASVLGWTCGNVIGSAKEVASFYYDLLGPPQSIVNAASLKTMSTMSPLSRGWAEGEISYGYGLMIQNVNVHNRQLPTLSLPGSYIGHAGDTYAFISDNGWFPALNASISVIVNQDSDFRYPSFVVTCKVVELVFKVRLQRDVNLNCLPATKQMYACRSWLGHKQCYPTSHGGTEKHTCEAACK